MGIHLEVAVTDGASDLCLRVARLIRGALLLVAYVASVLHSVCLLVCLM